MAASCYSNRMNELLILSGITAGAWIGLLVLRVPSSIAFLSLLIGQLLANEASINVYTFIASVTKVSQLQYVQVALLLLPLLLTVLFLRGRVAKSKLVIEAVPIVMVVALTILLVSPLVPQLNTLLTTATGNRLDAYKSIIVIAASVSGLLSAWLSYPKAAHHDKKHHK